MLPGDAVSVACYHCLVCLQCFAMEEIVQCADGPGTTHTGRARTLVLLPVLTPILTPFGLMLPLWWCVLVVVVHAVLCHFLACLQRFAAEGMSCSVLNTEHSAHCPDMWRR